MGLLIIMLSGGIGLRESWFVPHIAGLVTEKHSYLVAMRRSSSVELKRSPTGSRSTLQELLNGKWRVLTSPALLSSAVVSALGLFMLVRPDWCILALEGCSDSVPVRAVYPKLKIL